MPETVELDLSQLHEVTSEELFEAVMAESIIKTGEYYGLVLNYYARANADDAEFHPGREHASLHIQLFDLENPKEKRGTFFAKASWQMKLTKFKRPDKQSQHWVELAKAVGAIQSSSVPEILKLSKQNKFRISVEEVYKVPVEHVHESHQEQIKEGQTEVWVRVGADENEARNAYIDLGLDPFTFVKRYRRA